MPIEADDEDPFDFVAPPGPSPRDVRKRWAEEGNVQALLDIIRTTAWSMFSIGEILQLVKRACEVRAMSDPAGFSEEIFGRIVAVNAFLMMRSQIYLMDRVAGRGESPCTPTLADLSSDVTERLLPRSWNCNAPRPRSSRRRPARPGSGR